MNRRKVARAGLWIAVAALLWPRQAGKAEPGTETESWLAPAAHLAASVQWIRFDLALREGEPERAYVLAEKALALAPGPATGWSTLARHLVFDRASAESEPDAARRRRWIEAGLGVLARGSGRSYRPDELAYLEGLILTAYVAEIAPQVDWPGGRRAALERGAGALERAVELGARAERESGSARDAAVLLAATRRALAELDEG